MSKKNEEAQKRRFWITLSLIAGMFFTIVATIQSDNILKKKCLDRSELGVHACDRMGLISKIFSSE